MVPSGLGSGSVRTGFTTLGPLPNLEPDFWFSSGAMPNLGLDFSPVQKGLGPNCGSEPDCGITILEWGLLMTRGALIHILAPLDYFILLFHLMAPFGITCIFYFEKYK